MVAFLLIITVGMKSIRNKPSGRRRLVGWLIVRGLLIFCEATFGFTPALIVVLQMFGP
jgi:hypothetical protein